MGGMFVFFFNPGDRISLSFFPALFLHMVLPGRRHGTGLTWEGLFLFRRSTPVPLTDIGGVICDSLLSFCVLNKSQLPSSFFRAFIYGGIRQRALPFAGGDLSCLSPGCQFRRPRRPRYSFFVRTCCDLLVLILVSGLLFNRVNLYSKHSSPPFMRRGFFPPPPPPPSLAVSPEAGSATRRALFYRAAFAED